VVKELAYHKTDEQTQKSWLQRKNDRIRELETKVNEYQEINSRYKEENQRLLAEKRNGFSVPTDNWYN
jgi:hypothetical protein